jgi:serine/threonine protein kinase
MRDEMQLQCDHCNHLFELDEPATTPVFCPRCGKIAVGTSPSMLRDALASLEVADPSSPQTAAEGTVYELSPDPSWANFNSSGRFQILQELGRGGMGAVYLAHDRVLHRQVAIKCPRTEIQNERGMQGRVLREARAVAKLKHANIVPVYDVGTEGDSIFIISEFVESISLGEQIRQKGLFPCAEAAELCLKIADALEHAHRAGIVHRDLKPGNILMDREGQPHITDFGLAKFALRAQDTDEKSGPETDFGLAKFALGAQDADEKSGPEKVEGLERQSRAGQSQSVFKRQPRFLGPWIPRSPENLGAGGHDALTLDGIIMGTPAYMSPEQAAVQGDIDHRTDIFSFGVLMYELLTGKRPFAGDSVFQTIQLVLECSPNPPRKLNKKIPLALEAICLKCLAKDRNRRYQTATEIKEALRHFVGELDSPLRWLWQQAKKHPVSAGLAAAALVCALGGSLLFAWASSPSALVLFINAWLILLAVAVVGGPLWRSLVQARQQRAARIHRRENPYIVGPAINDPKHCFGRKELLTTLVNTITSQNWALLGEYRIGKTTIQMQLRQLLENLQDDSHVFFPVYVDLQHLQEEHDANLFSLIGQSVSQYARLRAMPESVIHALELTQRKPGEDYTSRSLKRDLDSLIAHWKTVLTLRQPVLVLQIDEVQLLQRIEYRKLSGFRAILVNTDNIRAVLSGVSIPKEQQEDLSPWWNIFHEEAVRPLTEAEARRLIVEPVHGLFSYSEDAVRSVLEASEQFRPHKLQMVCSAVLNYKFATGRVHRRITRAEVLESIQHASKPS